MKIAFVIRSLNAGGSERQTLVLARQLKMRGHEATICTFYPGGVFAADAESGAIGLCSIDKRGRWDFLSFIRLWRKLRTLRPDVVCSIGPVPSIVVSLLKPLLGSVGLIWSRRTAELPVPDQKVPLSARREIRDPMSRTIRVAERWMASRADVIVTNSIAGRHRAERDGLPLSKLTVVQNGIETERFTTIAGAGAELRKALNMKPRELLVGYPARLSAIKDHPTFIMTASKVLSVRRDVVFVCIGGGSEEYLSYLQSLVKRAGVDDHFHFVGHYDDMPAAYRELDLVCFTSRGEGFPNAIAEAMACGTPCVTTNVGDSALIVGDRGRVVPVGDVDATAEAVLDLLNTRPAMESIRERIVRYYGVAVMVTAFEQVCEQVVGRADSLGVNVSRQAILPGASSIDDTTNRDQKVGQ